MCCHASAVQGSAQGFALAALQGQDNGGGIRWGGEACAVLPCANPAAGKSPPPPFPLPRPPARIPPL